MRLNYRENLSPCATEYYGQVLSWGLVYSAFLLQVNRELGEMCTYSHDCQSGCCQLERLTKIRSCQSKALLGEKCTNAQVKADTYVDACPCVSGYGKCCLAQECLPMLPLTDGHFCSIADYCSFPKDVCTK